MKTLFALAVFASFISSAHATTVCVNTNDGKVCANLQYIQDSSRTHQRFELTELTQNNYPVERPSLFSIGGNFSAKDLCQAFKEVDNLRYFTSIVPDRVLGVFGDAVQYRAVQVQENVMYENGDCRLETRTAHYYDRVSCIARGAMQE